MTDEDRPYRLEGAGCESVSDVPIHKLIMSFHWPSKGPFNAMEAGDAQGNKENGLGYSERV